MSGNLISQYDAPSGESRAAGAFSATLAILIGGSLCSSGSMSSSCCIAPRRPPRDKRLGEDAGRVRVPRRAVGSEVSSERLDVGSEVLTGMKN
eukprot:1661578-Prymnesium_polylepis.3